MPQPLRPGERGLPPRAWRVRPRLVPREPVRKDSPPREAPEPGARVRAAAPPEPHPEGRRRPGWWRARRRELQREQPRRQETLPATAVRASKDRGAATWP